MAIRIITDSASDITQEEAAKMGIEVIPLTVTFGEESFRDGVTINHQEFFEKLIESDILPVTSQVSPFGYQQVFEKGADEEKIICITLSSKLSGCYQSACIAAEEVNKNICIIDSENVCIGERILVEQAVRYSREKMTVEEICTSLEKDKKNIRVIALLDTLEYLKKGGRISKATAFAGDLLGIKPVITVENGEVKLLGKARGSRNGNNLLKTLTQRKPIDFAKPFHLAYSGLSDIKLEKYISDSQDLYPFSADKLPRCSIGSVIGTHVGPGAIAAAFFVDAKE